MRRVRRLTEGGYGIATAIPAPGGTSSGAQEDSRTGANPSRGACEDEVPMPAEHLAALDEICAEVGVDVNLALGLIQLESSFDPCAVSPTGCYGYCQLSRYFPSDLSPEENLRAGIGWLGELLAQYGDAAKALTVYHLGSDDGSRDYANVVLRYAMEWGYAE